MPTIAILLTASPTEPTTISLSSHYADPTPPDFLPLASLDLTLAGTPTPGIYTVNSVNSPPTTLTPAKILDVMTLLAATFTVLCATESPTGTKSFYFTGPLTSAQLTVPVPSVPPPTRRRSTLRLGRSDTPSSEEIVENRLSGDVKTAEGDNGKVEWFEPPPTSPPPTSPPSPPLAAHATLNLSDSESDGNTPGNTPTAKGGGSREAAFFNKQKGEKASKAKELEMRLARMGVEEREKYDAEEMAKKEHEEKQRKHMQRLGGATARPKAGGRGGRGGRGRGGRGGKSTEQE